MKRSFIRGLWGIYHDDEYYKRRKKIDLDIELIKWNNYSNPFKTYVFGENNYKYLMDQGFDCILVDKNPMVYGKDTNTFQYIHKIKIWEYALQDYDEIIFLDFDCMEAKKIQDNFWETFYKKADIQCHLRGYRMRPCIWRPKPFQKLRPCASFVYMRDKNIPTKLMKIFDENKWMTEEQTLAKYIDETDCVLNDVKRYWDKFEPEHFTLARHELPFWCYPQDLMKTKKDTISFIHINRKVRNKNILDKVPPNINVEDKKTFITQKINGLLTVYKFSE